MRAITGAVPTRQRISTWPLSACGANDSICAGRRLSMLESSCWLRVMLTSRAAEKHRSKAMALGANDYLVKPAQDEVLLAAISKAIREQREALVG